MFSEAARGQIKKVMIVVFMALIYSYMLMLVDALSYYNSVNM